jgi:serine/threonine protein kinase
MQPDTPSPQLVITTTAKKAIKRAKVINISSMSDDSDSQNIRESKLGAIKGCRIDPKQLDISETVLGVGQLGIVHLGTYRGLLVACKSKRYNTHQKPYDIQARRELEFAAKLSLCRYINKYLGWVSCPKHWVERSYVETQNIRKTPVRKFYMIQNYAADGDARSYLNKRSKS